jgi:muramoyltetrapeptide carboxypeptidase
MSGQVATDHAPEHEHSHSASARPLSITLFTPAGAVSKVALIRRAKAVLQQAGCTVHVDEAAGLKRMRFGGTDEERLAAFERVAADPSEIALATRGGYGMTRLLPHLNYRKLAKSGKRWAGMSDMTAFSLAMLAKAGAVTWSSPLACDQLSREVVDEVTLDCFLEAMRGELEAVGFRCGTAQVKGLDRKGVLWGGNLTVLCSMLGTPYLPQIKGGILFVEDVNEHPYRIERMLLQLHQAGILGAQKAVLLGHFTNFKPSPNDRGYRLKTAIEHVASQTRVPILTGLPVGHVDTVVTLPIGREVRLMVQERDAFLVWEHHHE